MDVGVILINSTTIEVTWAAVDRETVRGHLLGYKVLMLYLLLFGRTYSASVLMNNICFGFTPRGATAQLGRGFRVLFSFKVVKNEASSSFR